MAVAWYSIMSSKYHIFLDCHGDDEILPENFACYELAHVKAERILCRFCFNLSLTNDGKHPVDCQEAWKKYNSQCGEN